ncbi:hypothetical protein DCAR_0310435 [Daucus carota subsp. sativus]|uniref:ATP-dependent DNA helicase n=1 Tax=Daucus carota subsp. sativus TaxID=79200 RepID=A0AAF1ASD4_DAUCS|nr:hypothetical protein DCAR_0310435 [Daucus carota subsp. sativus]
MTSLGVRVDSAINRRRGPFVFRASGVNIHFIGSLIPEKDQRPKYAQLYIYDTENEVRNRIATMQKNGPNEDIDEEIVSQISRMLDEKNHLVESFRKARDRYKNGPETSFQLRIPGNRAQDGRQYDMPTSSEIAGLIVGDIDKKNYKRDVIVHHKTRGPEQISDLHPSYMAMTYPLIHPYGEDGYRLGITLRDGKNLTMCQYYCFRLQQRLNEGHTLLRSGRLLQQYIVDCYMTIEEERFRWIRLNQNKLRSDLYSGLMDAVHRGDSNCSRVGKSIILPSSHTGGPRYRVQNYQDAMAICKWAGYPDLFITFTCNPKWPEINYMLELIGQKDDRNRLDIICRVFHIKLLQLMQDLKKEKPFGKIIASLYTIEFQKRGLPHAHILLFLDPVMKNPTASRIDEIVSAEIPDFNVDPDGYNAVKNFMLHGPCGKLNKNSPCMANGKCTKHFPKKYNDKTTFDSDGFPIYKRRNTGIHIKKNGKILDNRFVVPYNRNLIVKFDAHINIEVCNYSRSIKYLFKYVNKGPDRANATFESIDTVERIDEIKAYLDCRYISAAEACWRIFQFDINHRHPSVERLPFHLPGEHTIIFEEDKCVDNVLNRPGVDKTKFTEWLETNKIHEDARQLTYSDFPTRWVWNAKEKIWTRRKKGISVGRIYFAHPSSGERFYMRMLLNFVKGSTSFECIRTVNGVTYKTYKAACYALGLLDDDKEWIDCLNEAAGWATGNELRNLFVTILIHCQVSDASHLWKNCFIALSEDITSLHRKRFNNKELKLTEEQVEAYTLVELETLMQKSGKSLRDIDGMPQPNTSLLSDSSNRLVNEELDYDTAKLKVQHENLYAALNTCQKVAYEAILKSVENDEGRLFFISGHGGTGKTYLWNTIISNLRSRSQIDSPFTFPYPT